MHKLCLADALPHPIMPNLDTTSKVDHIKEGRIKDHIKEDPISGRGRMPHRRQGRERVEKKNKTTKMWEVCVNGVCIVVVKQCTF